jgi:hypothetical protein
MRTDVSFDSAGIQIAGHLYTPTHAGGIGIAVPAWGAVTLASGPGLACAGGLVVAVRGCRGRGRWW